MDNTIITIKSTDNGVSLTTENATWEQILTAAILMTFEVYTNNLSKYKSLKTFLSDFSRAAIATYEDYLKEKKKSISEE